MFKRALRFGTAFSILTAVALAVVLGAPIPRSGIAPPSTITLRTAAPRTPVINAPAPLPTLAPMPGTSVAVSRLPRLPIQSKANTFTPKMLKGRVRIMAASGATIDITPTSCAGSGSVGDDFNTGCSLSWQAINLIPSGDSYKDYYIAPTTGNEWTSGTAPFATLVAGPYTGPTGTTHSQPLAAGTSIFAVLDTTTNTWATVIYVNAGTVFQVKVYSDSFHTQEQYQYATGQTAFIYLSNVSSSDYFVVGISKTSQAGECVFMGPAPLPSPYSYPANSFCNLTLSNGQQAPGGNLAVNWQIPATQAAGNYSVEVYDLTLGQRLGQVQLSVTGPSGITLTTSSDVSTGVPNPSPNPVGTAASETLIAWNGATDQSVTGVKVSTIAAVNGNSYTWTLSDPNGQVIGTANATATGSSLSNVFEFNALSGAANQILQPGYYPARSFVAQLYNTGSSQVIASQAFQILGYSTQTLFVNGSGTTSAITLSTSGPWSMKFTNTSNSVFNQSGDTLSEIIWSTGPDFNPSGGAGNNLTIGTTTGGANCAPTCTATGTDTSGNTWNATITCGTAECTMLMTPVTAGTTLAQGATITVGGLYFPTSGNVCKSVCTTITSELPTHGIQWSCVPGVSTCTGGGTAYTSAYVHRTQGSGGATGTATFRFAGSILSTDACARTHISGTQPYTAPFVGTHRWESPFAQSDYTGVSPYALSLTTTRGATCSSGYDYDVYAFQLKPSGATLNYVAIQMPSLLLSEGFFPDGTIGGGWTVVNCNTGTPATTPATTFNSTFVCFHNAAGIASGATGYLAFENVPPLQSFAFQDFQVEGFDSASGGQSNWYSLTPVSASNTSPDGYHFVDDLAVGMFSLNAGDMTSAFTPSSIGSGGAQTIGATITNTSTAVDANPDSVDLVVLEAPSQTMTMTSTPTVSSPLGAWSYLGSFTTGSSDTQYWFGLCGAQYTAGAKTGAGNYGGPPTANGSPVTAPPAAGNVPYPYLGTCGNETNALEPGQTLTISGMTINNFGTSSMTWHMYAHGANSGGWSAGQTMPLNITPEAAEVWFQSVNGNTVSNGSVPTIGSSPNSYQYAIKNTSASSTISKILVTVPGLDINNQNAYDGSTNWLITNIASGGVTITSPDSSPGSPPYGCTVNTNASNTYNPTPQSAGTNGQIEVDCTSFAAGKTIYLNFTAANPSSNSDSYVWPATVDANTAGTAWLSSNVVKESFSIGLDLVVDPANPGPGNSKPVVNCSITCSFSGSTADFGNINDGASGTYADVVRASVILSGATSSSTTYSLYVEASNNPTNTSSGSGGNLSNELQIEDDSSTSGSLENGTTSTSGGTFNYEGVTTYTVIPTASQLYLALLSPITTPSQGVTFDLINSFRIQMGATDPTNAQTSTLTYTLITN